MSIYITRACVRVHTHTHSSSWHVGTRTQAHLSAVCTVFNYASVLKTVSLQKPPKRNDVKVQTHLSPKMFSINLPLTCAASVLHPRRVANWTFSKDHRRRYDIVPLKRFAQLSSVHRWHLTIIIARSMAYKRTGCFDCIGFPVYGFAVRELFFRLFGAPNEREKKLPV